MKPETSNYCRYVLTVAVAVCWLFGLYWGETVCLAQEHASAKKNTKAALTVLVVNGTQNGSEVTDNRILVRIFRGQQKVDTLEGKADQQGRAVFADIPAGPDMIAVASAEHDGILFQGEPVALQSERDTVRASVTVYDTTPDTSGVFVSMHHIIIKRLPEHLQISEYMQLHNPLDKVVKPNLLDKQGHTIVLQVDLPAGYRDFSSSGYFVDKALVFNDSGFYDTMSIAPGVYNVSFSYNLPIKSPSLNFSKKFHLATRQLALFLSLVQAAPSGLPAASGEMTMADKARAEYYMLGPYANGDILKFSLNGFKVQQSDALSWYILAGVFIILLILAVRRVMIRKSSLPEKKPQDETD